MSLFSFYKRALKNQFGATLPQKAKTIENVPAQKMKTFSTSFESKGHLERYLKLHHVFQSIF